MEKEKLKISALIGSFNEAHLLEDCLKSLQFCDEIVVVSLTSKDNTEQIAKQYATKYYFEEEDKLYFDAYHPKYIPLLKNDWFILIDPDERIMPELADDIRRTLLIVEENISVIRVPLKNYFKGKELKGTVYGGIVYSRLLYKKSGVNIGDEVHASITLKDGYDRIKIPYSDSNYDKHLWCHSYNQLINKHIRYSVGEGKVLFRDGNKYSLIKLLKNTFNSFYYSFKGKKGYLDGFRGLFLSILEARYVFKSWLSLKNYEKNIRK